MHCIGASKASQLREASGERFSISQNPWLVREPRPKGRSPRQKKTDFDFKIELKTGHLSVVSFVDTLE